ncbi:pectate lyase [Flavobacterium sp. JRM]|nr:pectate lyase [Flavobacterium sp. JRM]
MKHIKIIVLNLIALLGCSIMLQAQNNYKNWSDIIRKSNAAWFATPEAQTIAENVLLYQRNIGGWPKNIEMQKPLSEAEKQSLIALKSDLHDITTDNGATCQEMLFLAKMYKQKPDERYKKAFLLGLDYLLEAQYDNGGWPQFYPLKKGYYTHITYNDDSMFHILSILKQIGETSDYNGIPISQDYVAKAKVAFDKGITCIIKTQYKQNGVLTAWCAQHDENTLAPAKARAYELPSLSGKESAKIVLLLMSIDNPSLEVITAVKSACTWFEKTKITNLEEKRILNDAGKIIDKKMIPATNASPIWARFMELDNNEPFFCDRDGVKKKSLDEIGGERKNGYAWYTDEPKEPLKKYPSWEKKYAFEKSEKKKLNPKT